MTGATFTIAAIASLCIDGFINNHRTRLSPLGRFAFDLDAIVAGDLSSMDAVFDAKTRSVQLTN